MEISVVIPVVAAVVGLLCLGFLAWSFVRAPTADFRNLMSTPQSTRSNVAELRDRLEQDETGEEFEKVKSLVRKEHKKDKAPTLQERMFRAGIFSDQQKKDYRRLQLMLPMIATVLGAVGGAAFGGFDMVVLCGLVGTIFGGWLPLRILERRIKQRDDDIMFYLPLVIEQVSIGVSSSLDIGPCLQRIVQMADERDSHNAVTELIRYAQFHVKSGVGLEEALMEVGKLSGHLELKHSFMALAQVAKFGGEVTRQLQELADAVGAQRETKIEAKIKKLELEATAPVALVFFGFLVILLIGFGLQIITAI